NKEKLEHAGKHDGILAPVGAFAEVDALDFAIHQFEVEIVGSIGVVVTLVTDVNQTTFGKRSSIGPMKSNRRPANQGNYFFAGHARFDCLQILMGQRLLIPQGKLGAPLALV